MYLVLCDQCERTMRVPAGVTVIARYRLRYNFTDYDFCSADCLMRWLCAQEGWTINDTNLNRVPRG